MKAYVDENDIKRNIITYCNGTNTQQGLYVFGKDKIEVLSLADYTKQVRKEVCDDFKSRFLATCQIEKWCDTASFSLEVLNRILDQLQEDKQ